MGENKIRASLFSDVARAFDNIWHEGLKRKSKNMLPKPFTEIQTSLLFNLFDT